MEKDTKGTRLTEEQRAFVESHKGLAVSAAKSWLSFGLEFDDLLSSAMEGLCYAAMHYDPDKAAFPTYARHWIQKRFHQDVAPHRVGNAISLKPRVASAIRSVNKRDARLMARDNGEGITNEEKNRIFKERGVDKSAVFPLRGSLAPQAYLDRVVEETDCIPCEEYGFERIENEDYINRYLPVLTDKERYVLTSWYGIGVPRSKVLREIGDEFGVSRERVRQIIEKATDKIKDAIREDTTDENNPV